MVHDLRLEIGDRALMLDVSPSLPLVNADPRMLHHILINLVGNATKFTSVGRGIAIVGKRTAVGVELAISDEGKGLPPGDPAHLFERFTRVEGSDRTGGSGLGLANVKGFAVMGLHVVVANRSPLGATFTLCWPNALVVEPGE